MSDVAIFVEDPGAIAFIDGVPEALGRLGYGSRRLSGPVHVDDIQPALALVVGTAEHWGWGWLLARGRERGIPTIGLVDSCTSVEHRAKGLRNADWIAVPDEDTRQAYIARGFDPARVRACGHPRHDALYAMRLGVPRGHTMVTDLRPSVMFCTELSSSCDPVLDKNGRTEDALERFIKAVDAMAWRPRPVLRLHPKTPRALYEGYIIRGAFAEVSEGGSSADAILGADIIVGLTSSILDEAMILGRPAISIARPEERAALASWRHGLVPAAFTPEDIATAIQRASLPDRAAVEAAFPRGGAMNVARLIHDAIMEQMPTLDDGTVRLEPFADRHLTERYVGWLNDPATVRYSEQRHVRHTLESCRAYRATMASHKFWAITAPPHGHVGNVSATVDRHNRVADLAILVQPMAWGRGIGSRAWRLALDWLLGPGGMLKVTAGTMAANEPMLAVMEKAGMRVEGRLRGRFLLDGLPTHGVLMAKERECPNRG